MTTAKRKLLKLKLKRINMECDYFMSLIMQIRLLTVHALNQNHKHYQKQQKREK